MVSNFNSLKTFNLKEELNKKITERQNGKFSECSEDFDIEEFYVNDYVQECVDVFNQIDKKVQKRIWSKEEDNIILDYYDKLGIKIMNMLPSKSKDQIQHRAAVLGIKVNKKKTVKEEKNIKPKKRWSKEEIDILVEKYSEYGTKLCQILNRNPREIQAKARRLGLSYLNSFTQEEENILKKYYPIEGSKSFKRLTNHTKSSCTAKVYQLGLKFDISDAQAKERIGNKVTQKTGRVAIIVNYRRHNDIDVRFEDNNEVKKNVSYYSFINGIITNK